jgi:peptidoglycan/xylan/chitin deacetylase (PgdA/CDA1 family)
MQQRDRSILISFDVEEFDLPLEFGEQMEMQLQMEIGKKGLDAVEQLLAETNITTTLFTTANFAETFPGSIKMLAAKHEIGSHTYYHSSFETEHLKSSREKLEAISGKHVVGLRMPRMKQVLKTDMLAAGYVFDSSLNPTWLPGRYNHFNKPRNVFSEEGIIEVPVSVTPNFRIPLFWLSFKNFPISLYRRLALQTLKADGYLNLYFHPWEFTDVNRFNIPAYTKRHCGEKLVDRLHTLIEILKPEGDFISFSEFLSKKNPASNKTGTQN